MPSLRQVRIPQHETVDQALHGGVVDLLPQQLAENELVRWVVTFDAALKSATYEPEGGSGFRHDRGRWMGALLGRIGSALLQSRIPFYFASIFHIGRMMVVSAESLERIDVLRRPSNLDASVRNIVAFLTSPSTLPQSLSSHDSIQQSLLDGCDRASIRQRQQAELANRWWKRWQVEVADLRNAVGELEEGWRYCHDFEETGRMVAGVFRLWQFPATDSLQSEMARSGVRFRNLDVSATGTGWKIFEQNPILLVAMFALVGGRHRHPEPWFHLEHLVERWLDVERSKAEADHRRVEHQKSEIALQLLQRKYGDANPFDQFAVGVAAATSRLRDLVREHSLPDNTASPWRRMWEQRLEGIESYNRPLVGSGSDDEQLREWCFRTADSAIKQNINDSWAVGLPWNAFVQKLFNRKWIFKIAEMARNANEGEKQGKWTPPVLFELLLHVVEDLNKIGYELDAPASERLETLLRKLEKGESIYDSTDW